MARQLPLSRLAAKLHHESQIWPTPVAPTGWPFDFSPPLVLIGSVRRQPGAACQRIRPALAFLHESQIFRRDDLGDGEAVVQFGEFDILRASRRPSCRLSRRRHPRPKRGDVVLLIERHVIGGLRDAQNPHRLDP